MQGPTRGEVGRDARARDAGARRHRHPTLNSNLSGFSLKIGMSANYKKWVPGDNEELLYWPILNFYSEIWRTRKKTKSATLGF
jgi:hypothetical protein